ncbi:MAG: hypothetical protein EPO21_24740 [Chloroflexota bacterium]|nr:MAG: hypothetical protein EPO21_24740 [Chloroflexota bacterium]
MSQATGSVTQTDAKVEIVFPHDQAGVGGDVTAPLVNVTAMVFQHDTLTSATPDFANTVRLSRSFNNGVQQPVATGTKRIVTDSAGRTFPIWDFNDVSVPFASDPGNKYYFSLAVDGLPTFPNIWSHGADALTFLPQRDVLGAGNVAPPMSTTGLRYGMQAEMLGQDQVRILNLIRGAGFRWVKQQVRWSDLEPSPGQIDFSQLDAIAANAAAQRVNVLFSVVTSPTWARADHLTNGPPDNNADFGRFVGALAARYKGRVLAYEIWNEQNLSSEWAGQPINAGDYVELLKVGYNSIKSADPDTLVLAGALTPTGINDPSIAVDDVVYLGQMYDYQNGIVKNFADAVGGHMSGYNNAPEDFVDFHTVDTPGFKDHGSFYFRRIDQLHDVMARNGDTRQLWITEYEWGAADPPVPAGFEWTTDLTEEQVADFFVRSIQMIQSDRPWVGAVFIWNLNFRVIFPDFHTKEQAIFGILNPDGSPRLIYNALANLPK